MQVDGATRSALCLLMLLASAAAVAWDRRDIVFDCPCSAEFVAGVAGNPGTLTLSGGVRSHRAVESGELRISARRWDGEEGASTGRLSGNDRRRNQWNVAFEEPASGAVIEIHLLEETGRDADGAAKWYRHEALALWPVPRDGTSEPIRFVDILTDSDGDGVGDVNERLAGTSPTNAASTPGESVVDVLALYTAEFAEVETGYPYTRLLHAISVSSALFEDSATNIRLRLVGMSEVGLDEDGYAERQSRQALMDSHGADMSVLFSPTGPCTTGCAERVAASRTSRWSDTQSFDPDAIGWVTAHELGHAMGLAHSARQG